MSASTEGVQVDIPCPGLMVEYHSDGVIIYRILDFTRETIDAWAKTIGHNDSQTVVENRHARTLLDLRAAGYPSPYSIRRGVEVAMTSPERLIESFAVLATLHVTYQFMQLILRRIPERYTRSLRLFYDEQAALDWLEQRRQEIGD